MFTTDTQDPSSHHDDEEQPWLQSEDASTRARWMNEWGHGTLNGCSGYLLRVLLARGSGALQPKVVEPSGGGVARKTYPGQGT